MIVGDELTVRLRPGINTATFGPSWRFAKLSDVEFDVISREPMLVLDDGGPKVYLADITDLHVRASADDTGE